MKIKNTTLTILTGLSTITVAHAGDGYSAKSGKEIIPPPAPTCIWSWFAGGSVGHLDEWDEEMYTLNIGTERKCPGSNCSQSFYLEIGFTNREATAEREDGAADIASALNLTLGQEIRVTAEADIIPITLNYRYECALTQKLSWHVGAGAGIALVDLEFRTSVDSQSYDDTTFYAQAFAGIVYNISESFEVSLGARYIFMDDPDLTGFSGFDSVVSLDEDILIEIGGRINF